MQQKIMNMLEADEKLEILTDTRLSFKPFLNYVRARLQDKNSVKKEVMAFILDKFAAWPHPENEVSLEQLPEYKEQALRVGVRLN